MIVAGLIIGWLTARFFQSCPSMAKMVYNSDTMLLQATLVQGILRRQMRAKYIDSVMLSKEGLWTMEYELVSESVGSVK